MGQNLKQKKLVLTPLYIFFLKNAFFCSRVERANYFHLVKGATFEYPLQIRFLKILLSVTAQIFMYCVGLNKTIVSESFIYIS